MKSLHRSVVVARLPIMEGQGSGGGPLHQAWGDDGSTTSSAHREGGQRGGGEEEGFRGAAGLTAAGVWATAIATSRAILI